jgi:hypothetical protein
MTLSRRRGIAVAACGVAVLLCVVAFVGSAMYPNAESGPGRHAVGADTSGAAAPGSRPAPCVGVRIGPGDDLQHASEAHPEGATFCLLAGVHRVAGLVPRAGQRFVGEGEATVLTGAKVLEAAGATADGAGRWYWEEQTGKDEPRGQLIAPGRGEPPNEGDRFAQELFVTPSGRVNDPPTRMKRVTSLSDLAPGRWYHEEATGRLYVAENPPTLGLIELSVVPMAIGAPTPIGPPDVSIENLVIEKYASPTQAAAVGGPGSTDWTIRWVTVRYNHGTGIELGPGTLVEHCSIHHMGQEGLSGGGDAIRRPTMVRSTEVAYNRTLSFDPDWDAGGAKFSHAYGHGLIIENSWFHNNFGHGLWLDIDNDGVTVRSNRIEANGGAGIFYEVSRNGHVYWNDVLGQTDGRDHSSVAGAGIAISNSADVDVHANLLRDNANGVYVLEDRDITRWGARSFRQGLPHIDGVRIHDNDIQMPRGVTGMHVDGRGVLAPWQSVAYWQADHVSFTRNTYRVDSTQKRFLGPGNVRYTFAQWQGLGHDRTGRVLQVATHGLLPVGSKPFAMSDYGAWSGWPLAR